jgi:L-threonylcarbamoyladenylate synthase
VISNADLQHVADIYHSGGIFAYPTESVFGLGCDPQNESAVNRLLKIKQRPVSKGLILIASRLEQLDRYIDITESQAQIILNNLQPPVSWLVKTSDHCPKWVTGKHHSLAIRITQHPVAQRLCDYINQPLVSTSANPATKIPARTAAEVTQYFGDAIDFIVPGETGGLVNPTEIRNLMTGEIIRSGQPTPE